MAKIVFWSPKAITTGATHSAIAISSMMALDNRFESLLMQTHFQSKKIEASFAPYSDLKAMEVFTNSNVGLTALIRLTDSNKLTPESIRNYARPVLKNRLDILYGFNIVERALYKKIADNTSYILDMAGKAYDIVFLDMPKGTENPYIDAALKTSDMIIITLRQDNVELDDFFEKYDSIQILKDKPHMIVIGDYDINSKYTLFNIKNKYRTKVPIYGVVHSVGFKDACNDGMVMDYLMKNLNAPRTDAAGALISEVRRMNMDIVETLKIRD